MASALSDSDPSDHHTSDTGLDFFTDLGLDHCDGLVKVWGTRVPPFLFEPPAKATPVSS